MKFDIINIITLIIVILFTIHWILTIILCLQEQKTNKVFWAFIIFLAFPVGQFYFRLKNGIPII